MEHKPISYQQIDGLSEAALRDALGDSAKGKNEAQMRAMIKGAMRAREESEPEFPEQRIIDEQPGTMQEAKIIDDIDPAPVIRDVPTEVVDEDRKRVIFDPVKEDEPVRAEEFVKVSLADIKALRADIDDIRRENRELKGQINSRTRMSKQAKQEAAHARCRISDFFRDILAEQRLWLNEGIIKQVVVARSFLVESQHFANGRFVPCAKNGGMYYVRNKAWKASPRTGIIRQPITFNRHLYVDYTIKGNQNELNREDFELCDITGKAVQPYMDHLPIENAKAILAKGKARAPDLVDALKKLGQGDL